MKKLRKMVSLLLAVVMMMSLCAVQVIADDDTASLTITDATEDAEYSVYRILDVTVGTDSEGETTYAYTPATGWENFFTQSDVLEYVEVDTNGYVTWKDGVSTSTASMQAFAALMATYITSNDIQATATDTADDSGSITFADLPLGYYYVTSSVGTLVVLDTVGEGVSVVDKNAKPTIDKEVSGDGTTYAGTSTTDLTETVYYQVTIKGIDEVTVLVLHDDLPSGFELDDGSITVTLYSTVGGEDQEIVLTLGTDYTVKTSGYTCSATSQNGFSSCDFEVDFTELLTETSSGNYYTYVLNADNPEDAYIVVSYTASVTEAYRVNLGTSTGNVNTAAITTNATEQKEATTTTYTYDFYVYKYDGDSADEDPLEGAEFVLTNENGEYAKFDTGGYLTGWVTVLEDACYLTSDTDGLIHVIGLDVGSYTLTETKAPDGYALSSSTISVSITSDGAQSTSTVTVGGVDYNAYKFENTTNSEMPSTGGIGTTIFYVVGGILVVAAVVLLITRRRMKDEDK